MIKLYKTKIDAIILEITKLENNKVRIEGELLTLENSMHEEQGLYSNTEYSYFLDNYLTIAKKRKDSYLAKIIEIESEIDRMRDDLAVQFSELKKFEILLKNKQKAIKYAAEKKEEFIVNDNILMKYNYERKL